MIKETIQIVPADGRVQLIWWDRGEPDEVSYVPIIAWLVYAQFNMKDEWTQRVEPITPAGDGMNVYGSHSGFLYVESGVVEDHDGTYDNAEAFVLRCKEAYPPPKLTSY